MKVNYQSELIKLTMTDNVSSENKDNIDFYMCCFDLEQ